MDADLVAAAMARDAGGGDCRVLPGPHAQRKPQRSKWRDMFKRASSATGVRWVKMAMERILFGDNQFFGVNHMSEERARAQAMKFQDVAAIIEVIDIAYDEGIKAFMCTTHDRIAEVCDHVRQIPFAIRISIFIPGCPMHINMPMPPLNMA